MKSKILCDADISKSLASDSLSLHYPLFALDTRAQKQTYVEYKNTIIHIQASEHGRATIKDQDIVIYCISHMVKQLKKTGLARCLLDVSIHDFLKTTKKSGSGSNYERFRQSLERLHGTEFTVIKKDDAEQIPEYFKFIVNYSFENSSQGYSVEIEMPNWIVERVQSSDVVFLTPDYFDISNPSTRRLYQVFQAKCGRRAQQKILIPNLLTLTGLKMPIHKFKKLLCKMAIYEFFPRYRLMPSEKLCYIYRDSKEGRKALLDHLTCGVLLDSSQRRSQYHPDNIVTSRRKSS